MNPETIFQMFDLLPFYRRRLPNVVVLSIPLDTFLILWYNVLMVWTHIVPPKYTH